MGPAVAVAALKAAYRARHRELSELVSGLGSGRHAPANVVASDLLPISPRRKRPATVKLRVRASGQAYEVLVVLRGAGKGKARVVQVDVRKIGSSQ
jgi:hypothetical protein